MGISKSPSPRRRRRRSSSDSRSSRSSSSSVEIKRKRENASPAPRRPSPPASNMRRPSPPRSRSATPDKYNDTSFDIDEIKRKEDAREPHSRHHHYHRDRDERDREDERRKAEREEKEKYLAIRRENRCILAEEGVHRHKCWEASPDRPNKKSRIIRLDSGDSESDSDVKSDASDGRKKKKSKKNKRDKKEKKVKKRRRKSESEDEWIEVTKESIEQKARDSDEEGTFGPKIPKAEPKDDFINQRIKYGRDLAYEGRQMAAYVATGERIPRRGEIGMQSEDILKFEKMGYVMSGSRHRGMEAMRIKKENQIYSAEEKRMLNSLTQEERKKKETQVLNQFRQLIHQKKQQ